MVTWVRTHVTNTLVKTRPQTVKPFVYMIPCEKMTFVTWTTQGLPGG
jgi:hypothetical protein